MNLKVDSESDGIVKVSATEMISLSSIESTEPLGALLGDDPYKKQVLLNLGGAERIDSSGVGWLVTCHKRFAEGGGTLVLHSVQPFVTNVLKVVRLNRFFNIAPNERLAESQLRGESNE